MKLANTPTADRVPLAWLVENMGLNLTKPQLLEAALTHKSYSFENGGLEKLAHNEKLEFLGDAVLDLVLGQALMEDFPNLEEGSLSKMRAHLVNESSLAEIAVSLRLSDEMRLGKGELQSNGKEKPRLLASCFEAVVGAIFVDCGFEKCKQVLRRVFSEKLLDLKKNQEFDRDYKSQLQEFVQANHQETPVYKLVSSQGPAHDRTFVIQVVVGSKEVASGEGKSKKAAEQTAASVALKILRNEKEVSNV